MAICNDCKKYPLEFGEISEITDEKGRDKVLCDDCYKKLFQKLRLPIK